MNKKIIIIVLAVIILISAGFYFIYKKHYFTPTAENNPAPRIEKPFETAKSDSEKPKEEIKNPTPSLINGYKLYKNAEFGFEIQYPSSWMVTEEVAENVRGEMVKEFLFKKPNSDLHFAVLPRDGLSYGISEKGTSTPAFIGGFEGAQTQYVLKDGRRIWLIFPNYGLYNWLEDLGRIDAMTSAVDPVGDTKIFEQMLNSFKLSK